MRCADWFATHGQSLRACTTVLQNQHTDTKAYACRLDAALRRVSFHARTSQPAGAAVKPNFPSAAASATNTSGASSKKASIASYGPGPCDRPTGCPFTLLRIVRLPECFVRVFLRAAPVLDNDSVSSGRHASNDAQLLQHMRFAVVTVEYREHRARISAAMVKR